MLTRITFASRTSLIFTAVVTFAVAFAVGCFSAAPDSADGAAIGNESWTARMGWRYVTYVEGDVSLWLSIEPMVKGDDRVCESVPLKDSFLVELEC